MVTVEGLAKDLQVGDELMTHCGAHIRAPRKVEEIKLRTTYTVVKLGGRMYTLAANDKVTFVRSTTVSEAAFEELKVTTSHLLKGDVILLCNQTKWDNRVVLSSSVTDNSYPDYYKFQYAVGDGRVIERSDSEAFVWTIKRPKITTPVKSPTQGKIISEYPHFCTRCGLPSYNGLFEVSHQNEKAAANCPARRR